MTSPHPAHQQTPHAADSHPEAARLIAVHADAAAFYTARLRAPTAEPQRRYLADRGLAGALYSPAWDVGYAPADWTTLTDHLRHLGYSDDTLIDSGLALHSRRGTLIDRFRDRITFSIHNQAGDPVGFIARAAPSAGPTVPKYLNSPHTAIYDKAAVLFGLAEQRGQLAEGATPVIVEGPLDVLAVEVIDDSRYAAVAPCGTALTGHQVTALAMHTDSRRVLVAFDPDHAGVNASINSYPLLAKRFSTLDSPPLTHDPAGTLASGGPDALAEPLSASRPLVDHIIDAKLEPWRDQLDNVEVKIAALRSTAKTLAGLGIDQPARQVAELAETLDLPYSTVTREITEATTRQDPSPRHHRRTTPDSRARVAPQ